MEVNKELKDLSMLAGQLTGLLAVEQPRNKKKTEKLKKKGKKRSSSQATAGKCREALTWKEVPDQDRNTHGAATWAVMLLDAWSVSTDWEERRKACKGQLQDVWENRSSFKSRD